MPLDGRQRIDVFGEFTGFGLLAGLAREGLELPTAEGVAPTKTVGDEVAADEMKQRNVKLFFTEEEDTAGAVDKFVEELVALGFELVERNPYRSFIVGEGEEQTEAKSFFGDRVILQAPAA